MERLTFDGNFCEIAQCRDLPCQNGGSCSQRKVWERLKEYEDTRLTPAEVRSLWKEWNAMMSVLNRIGGYDRLRSLAEADKAGRVIVTGAPSDDKRDGLRQKYRVYKAKDNTPVEDCFVLRPEKDPAARIALEAYAKATDNKALSEDILAALGDSGRVMVLPCKVGDRLYEVTGRKTISVYKIRAIRVELFGLFIEWDIVEGFVWQSLSGINDGEIGKTVFLTREEAEKALEATKDD